MWTVWILSLSVAVGTVCVWRSILNLSILCVCARLCVHVCRLPPLVRLPTVRMSVPPDPQAVVTSVAVRTIVLAGLITWDAHHATGIATTTLIERSVELCAQPVASMAVQVSDVRQFYGASCVESNVDCQMMFGCIFLNP